MTERVNGTVYPGNPEYTESTQRVPVAVEAAESPAAEAVEPGAVLTDEVTTVLEPELDAPEDYSWAMSPTGSQGLVELPPVTVRRRRVANAFGLVIGVVVAFVVALTALAFVNTNRHADNPTNKAATPVAGASSAAAPAGGAAPASAPAVPATANAASHLATVPLADTQTAEFQLATGVTTVIVRAVDLGDTLFRAVTPDPSGFVPRATQAGGQVRLQVVKVATGDGTDTVVVELNVRVRWQVTLVGGSASATVDLRGATVSGVDFAGGVDRIETWLPAAHGAQTVRMAGGAREMTVHAPRAVPVRVGIGKGSSKVTLDGSVHTAVAPGSRFAPTGWEQAADRYDLDAAGGVGTLTVDRY